MILRGASGFGPGTGYAPTGRDRRGRTPADILRWFEIVDELTRETGLVTSGLVPARAADGG